MKNKGFTLIELLAVIIILAVVLAIAIPAVASVVDNAKTLAYKNNEKLMANATRLYIGVDNSKMPYNVGDITYIDVTDLKRSNVINSLKDVSDRTTDCTGKVLIQKIGTTNYSYYPYLKCGTNYETSDDFVRSNDIVRSVSHLYNTGPNNYTITINLNNINNTKELITPTSTIGLIKSTILNYTTWVLNTSGGQSGFSANGTAAENQIILKDNPWGRQDVVWASLNNDATSDADGGYGTSYYSIDKTKKYRYTVWVRKENVLSADAGTTYFGFYGSPNGAENWDGTRNTNPYFNLYDDANWRGTGYNFPQNEWLLSVGYVYPYGASTADSTSLAGMYRVNGTQLRNSQTNFRWASDNTTAAVRAYLYYSIQTDERQYWYRPRFEIVDGSEPSITELLSGSENPNVYDYAQYNTNGTITYTVATTGVYNFTINRSDNTSYKFSYTVE